MSDKYHPPDERWVIIGKNISVLPRNKMTKDEKKSLNLIVKKLKTKKIIKSIMDDSVIKVNACKNIPVSKKRNKGEKGETRIIEFLFSIRNEPDKICKMFRSKSKIQLIDPSSRLEIKDIDGIKKGPSRTKADIIIYFTNTGETMYVSIKCNDGASPTLLNHTNRACDYFQNKLSSKKLERFDSVISKRNTIGKQDVKIKEIKDKLNEEEIDVLVEVISYFTFDGTGCSESNCPANSILIVNDSNNIISTSKFINCKEEQDKINYIKDILPILGLNMRSGRGMPGKKNHEEKMKLCEPWLFHDTKDKLCGALAIRFI